MKPIDDDVVFDYEGLDNPVLLLLVAYRETSEDLRTDPSDDATGDEHKYADTRASIEARALQVGLVVLWDVVGLWQHLKVDGDAWPAVWR